MNRLTTDNPENNIETMMNYAYAKDGRVYLRYADGEEDVDLCKYIANNACCEEIDATAVMDGACMECDCKTAILNTVAIQAAELRARLKEYEDAGLSPEDIREIRKLVEIDQLKELLKAKAEERLVVLPCKVGDTVWVAGEKRVIKCEIEEAYLDDVKGLEYLASFNCEYLEQGGDYCNGCPFYNWHQDYSGEWDCDSVWGNASVKGADFGKTVFLSREEAEAALKGGES